jgi:hypothetical protein
VNLLEPWVFLRLAAGTLAFALFLRGAWTAMRVLRHFDIQSAAEGQLALERQVELAFAFVRFAVGVQVANLLLTVLAADRLSGSIRGAMCAFGVFNANERGFRALSISGVVALAAGMVSQLYALDARLPTLALVRPLAVITMLLAPLAAVDFAMTAKFLLNLDLTAVASCCSVQLDAESSGQGAYVSGPRQVAAALGAVLALASVGASFGAARRPSKTRILLVGGLTALALPVALAAVVLEVAPHAFEAPQHACPFCLLKGEVWGLGYPLFGALYVVTALGLGLSLCALVAGKALEGPIFPAFARQRLRWQGWGWLAAFLLGAAPIVRYALISGGASLFP